MSPPTSLRSSAFVLIVAFTAACARPAPLPSADPNADVVLRYPVASAGEITFTVRPRYPAGAPISLGLDIRAGSAAERGGTEVAAGSTQRYGTVIEVRAP